MAFKSFDELINMSAKDPERAESLVAKAKQVGKPVVSKNNSGYGSGAVRRRLMTSGNTSKKKVVPEDQDYSEIEASRLANRNKNGY